ncbi:MAG: carbamoyltransferase family protein [Actinomycetota bacterium]
MLSLGVNLSHTSSACLARDAKVVVALAEERLSRIKHDTGFPWNAIRTCLDMADVRLADLDAICFSTSHPFGAVAHELKMMLRGQVPLSRASVIELVRVFGWGFANPQSAFAAHIGRYPGEFRFVEHHLAHAIPAYVFSGFRDAAVAVIDGRGGWESTSIWHGTEGRLAPLRTIPWPNSLGLFYMTFTEHLGFKPLSDEWKVMGLAPYGRPGVSLKRFIDLDIKPYRVAARLLLESKFGIGGIKRVLGPGRRPDDPISDRHRDLAFAVQGACEQAMRNVAAMAIRETGANLLCLGGGVAMNAKGNGVILGSGLAEDVFVPPAAADDGAAIGAALAPFLDGGGRLPIARLDNVYWGPAYDDEIEGVLKRFKLPFREIDSPAEHAAGLLEAGRIIGWFQGRMEFGERALGARSILADPRPPEMKDRLNDAVKFRESWRPFAPSIQLEAAPKYLAGGRESPFMTTTFDVNPEFREQLGAVTHVDGTTRPQTVKRETNPLFWDLIEAFRERTGVPAVLNTSFNLQGEPIVCKPEDAIRTFFTSGLDDLILGNFLLEK